MMNDTKVSQRFCNILVVCEAEFSISGCFCSGHEGDNENLSSLDTVT